MLIACIGLLKRQVGRFSRQAFRVPGERRAPCKGVWWAGVRGARQVREVRCGDGQKPGLLLNCLPAREQLHVASTDTRQSACILTLFPLNLEVLEAAAPGKSPSAATHQDFHTRTRL